MITKRERAMLRKKIEAKEVVWDSIDWIDDEGRR